MIQTGIESRVKIQDIVSNQLPEFVLDESPKAVDFLKQYYISQEYQGGPTDIVENLDQYLKVDNLTPEVVVGSTTLSSNIDTAVTTITVPTTKGFPNQYGLLKIDDEIITYTGLTTNTFTGCVRGFSGITSYHADLNEEELVFSTSTTSSHSNGATVQNLSSLFLKEFYNKIKTTFTPGFENRELSSEINVGNFIKEARSFYESKGTDDSFRILFNVLYGETPSVINLEDYVTKPSDANFIRREVCVAEAISGDPTKLVGQTLVKTTDAFVSASISAVEPFTRDQKQFFKISLFVGFDENSSVQGNFQITPSSKVLEKVSVGSSVISVDSTIGFPESGTMFSGDNTITYTNKSVNQFLECSGVTSEINATDNIHSDDTYFAYEEGDTTKKVVLRLTGVLSNFVQKSKNIFVDEGQEITVKNIGTLIKNPEQDKTYKEIFANSWIYNTSSSAKIKNIGGASVELFSQIDRSQLKKGDLVEFIDLTGSIVYPTTTSSEPYVSSEIALGSKTVELANFDSSVFVSSPDTYSIRRKINKASSTSVNFQYGNEKIISDIQNLYVDDDFAYVASNSLPSSGVRGSNLITDYAYRISRKLNSTSISSTSGSLQDINVSTGLYTSILFDTNVPFVSGDRVKYNPTGQRLKGLVDDFYYVKVSSSNPKKIKLFTALSFLTDDTNAVEFESIQTTLETHTFVLYDQRSQIINPQKVFKKFNLNQNITNGTGEKTTPGTTGMLINGVEISNYKTFDKVYYGPIEGVKVLSGGSNFDVINPPVIEVSAGSGTTALVQPVVKGKIKEVIVDKQDFDINEILSITSSGLNGSGGSFEPITILRKRDLFFDARSTTEGGGIDISTNQLTFIENHNLQSGDEVVYKNLSNESVSIGLGLSSLIDNATYIAKVDNDTTIQLFDTLQDYTLGINPISFGTTALNGTQKFQTGEAKKTLSEVRVLDGGSFTNRKLLVKPTGISTSDFSINFANHGFSNGEVVEYSAVVGLGSTQPQTISGLSESTQYFVLTDSTDSFRLCDAGVGATITTNFDQENFVKFTSTGTGFQQFRYPDLELTLNYNSVGLGTTTQVNNVILTPVVKGSIEEIYVYEPGTKYGSEILNFEKKPTLTTKTGKEGQVKPIITSGIINSVNLQFGGREYFSVPELEVFDPTGSGSGAKLRAEIDNGKITAVNVINSGIGYSNTTVVNVIPNGSGEIFDASIRSLSVNYVEKLSFEQQTEQLKDIDDSLSYSVNGYFNILRNSFNDTSNKLSGIIGWAYDGNPIYGSYAPVDPTDINSGIKTMTSGYLKDASNIQDRPSLSSFPLGFFVEDYKYDSVNGDLDKNNGRFAKTEEFPNGVYAYYATVNPTTGDPIFPYFIGDEYRSNTLEENESLDQTFDFNNSSLLRNTFGYRIAEPTADNDFIIESNEIKRQKIVVNSTSEGSVSSINILNSGENYKVGEKLKFNNTGTSGGGLTANISSLKGKTVDSIETTKSTGSATLVWRNDGKVEVVVGLANYLNFIKLEDNDYVLIDDIKRQYSSTDTSDIRNVSDESSKLRGYHKIDLINIPNVGLTTEIKANSGVTTEIYVTDIPPDIENYLVPTNPSGSGGSTIGIGTETLEILNVYRDKNVIRVHRGLSGTAHTVGMAVTFNLTRFTIDADVDYFESRVHERVNFNPTESIGIGTTPGVGIEVTYSFGDEIITGSVPTQRISLPDHPFKTNQKLEFNKGTNSAISISTTPTGTPFPLPTSVYAVNKSPNTIGIKTTLNSDEVYFRVNGTDVDDYYFQKNYDNVIATVSKINSIVSISSAHGLSEGDLIALNVKPNLSVGIGTSTAIRVNRNSNTENIQINPIGFSSLSVDGDRNRITIIDHGFDTGDKVYYDADTVMTGVQTGSYYVHKQSNSVIQLCETLVNANSNPPVIVSFGSTGGVSQTISEINPRIESIKNNNLVFDLSDSSLTGYEFKLFYDREFKNEFVSIGNSSIFNTSSSGTVGSANATFTLSHGSNFPDRLYYSLEKSGFISTSDKEVKNYSEILFVDSVYNKEYKISEVGVTTFTVSLEEDPERLSYTSSDCDTLEYTTKSTSASGPVDKIHLVSSGIGYKKLPLFNGVNSSNGKNLLVTLETNTIGKVLETKIVNEGFEYSSDKTLQPEAFISPKITLKDSNTVGIITVTNGGVGYVDAPRLVVVNNDTRAELDSGLLRPILSGSSITDVSIDVPPKGISDQSAEIFAVNNTNGVSVTQVLSDNTGIFTCILTTPSAGFTTDVFAVNDEVFVEGITKYSSDGTGFNASDYGFKFFTVSKYENKLTPGLNADQVTFNLAGLTTQTGIAQTITDSYATVVNKTKYPSFTIELALSNFDVGEKLLSDDIERDLEVIGFDNSGLIKVFGSYQLSVGETIKGKTSGNVATIETLTNYDGIYEIKFSNRKEEGWEKQTGKLNEDYQVLPDNDYYQNLSYSIKSRQQWKDIRTPVNSLVHSVGIKNFADTEVLSDSDERVGISTTEEVTTIIRDFTDEKRVDTINNFDYAKDIDILTNRSKFIRLSQKRLTNYTEALSNKVLRIDDIQDQFSSSDSEPLDYKDILQIDDSNLYNNYIFKVSDVSGKNHIQLTNMVFLNDSVNNNKLVLEKQSLVNVGLGFTTENDEQYGDFSLETDEFGDTFLRFTPEDPYDTEYDIKFIEKRFNNSTIGIGTSSIGFIDLTSRAQTVLTNTTESVIGVSTDKFTALYVNALVTKEISGETNFVELYLTHDGDDTNLAEYYFDTSAIAGSSNFIGSFGATVNSGIVSLTYLNDSAEDVVLRTRTVGFGTTAVGVGTFRYRLPTQPIGAERSATYETGFTTTTAGVSTAFLTLDKNNFDSSRSLVEVSIGDTTKSVHQLMMVHDGTNVFTQQSSYISIGSTFGPHALGVGTFGGEFSGDNVLVKFYPDANFNGDTEIKAFSECFYTSVDFINEPPSLLFGNSIEDLNTSQYLAINGDRINKTDFVLRSDTTPIFAKTINPEDSTTLNQVTGVFTVKDHFFSNAEELIYTPGSTFVGVGSTPMMYKQGSIEAELPTQVFAIVVTEDTFQIATTKAHATAGTAVTITSPGEGNAHEFAMSKRNEKTIITLDNIAQYPLLFTNVAKTLNGSISTTATTFRLNDISSVNPLELLKVDDEYMRIVNVGLGVAASGPITNTGTIPLVNVERGSVGSAATNHANSATARIYKGSYNIVGDSIHFITPPRGNSNITRTERNLKFETSDFTGRVFLRKDYSSNQVYDDVSSSFDGKERTHTLTVSGVNTSGIGTTGGNGVVFINGIFQTPTTENNPLNNFSIIETLSPSPGVSSIRFSGIRTDGTNEVVISESDVNMNEIPRGGVIVSLGFTGGLGYAPLAGAAVTAVVGSTGNIVSVGLGSSDDPGSGYNGLVAIGATVVDVEYDHRFVSSVENSITDGNGGTHTATNAVYNSVTGDLVLTIPSHGLTTSDTIGIDDDGLVFTCSKDNHTSNHSYPRAVSKTKQRRGLSGGDPIRGSQVSITATTLNTVQINVGPGGGAGTGAVVSASVVNTVGAGGSLSFAVSPGGSGYVNPMVLVSEPSYAGLAVTGISRLGVGPTVDTGDGLLLDIVVGASNTVGVGSTLFSVNSFNIARNGYSFRKGDKFSPVGLVTGSNLSSPISELQFEVLEVFHDNFGAWQFGELDFIDSIKNYQDGVRIRFPLFYNGSLLSFEKPEDSRIELQNALLVIINGVIQEPGDSYVFDGGTSFAFSVPPKPTDVIDVFFYRGTRGLDDVFVDNILPTIEAGDTVQLFRDDLVRTTKTQDPRTVFDITSSDKFETSLYLGDGIDEVNDKPLYWTKQKRDLEINGEIVPKTRKSTIAQIYPTAKVIFDIDSSDNRIFVDDVSNFTYNLPTPPPNYNALTALLVDQATEPSPANIVATIDGNGSVSSLTIQDEGSGYTGSTVNIKFQNPFRVGVGFGTTATATATVGTGGTLTGTTITNPGFGYSSAPNTIVPLPDPNTESLGVIADVKGFSGIVTGIEAVSGWGGHSKALKFFLDRGATFGGDLQVGYPIMIRNTQIGTGVTSVIESNAAVVGIGTTFLDNIYYIGEITTDGNIGIVTCNVDSSTDLSGISSEGDFVGEFSWGLFDSITRSNNQISIGVTGKTVDVGLSTFPTIQRRGEGLRKTGALPETVN